MLIKSGDNMERESMLKVCRLTYMLIDELVENEEQKEKNLKTVDRAVEELCLKKKKQLHKQESTYKMLR